MHWLEKMRDSMWSSSRIPFSPLREKVAREAGRMTGEPPSSHNQRALGMRNPSELKAAIA